MTRLRGYVATLAKAVKAAPLLAVAGVSVVGALYLTGYVSVEKFLASVWVAYAVTCLSIVLVLLGCVAEWLSDRRQRRGRS
ncbi:hypothetical protein [Nocardia sp. NPDC049149]|uniref:hypothetical protein n=1 Tax=Nocardia sp. NPDC049149 TaxID=3364315 RepID=UPI00371A26C2